MKLRRDQWIGEELGLNMIRTHVFMYELIKIIPCQSILWTSVIECFVALTNELEQYLRKDFK